MNVSKGVDRQREGEAGVTVASNLLRLSSRAHLELQLSWEVPGPLEPLANRFVL